MGQIGPIHPAGGGWATFGSADLAALEEGDGEGEDAGGVADGVGGWIRVY